jgi:lipid II:glycine glycyltransferase (peptidoglycan interpeptide bridge formation enzyme)
MEALSSLLQVYKRKAGRRSLFTELRNVFPISELQPVLAKEGFSYQEHLNYLIDLDSPPEAIFQRIGSRTRKNIRRGMNRGKVIIQQARDREQVAVCYELIQKTYQRAKVPLADRSLFEAAFDLLYPKGMVRFTLAYVEDQPAAVSVELLYKKVVYGWYSGMERSYSAYVPNELIMWHLLQWGAENGYQVYDFGGAGKPDEKYGVRDFKAKFGGDLVGYGRNVWISTPLLFRMSEIGYAFYRKYLYPVLNREGPAKQN